MATRIRATLTPSRLLCSAQTVNFKANMDLNRKSGKKALKLKGIAKLDDANHAGGNKSEECTLILTEGDSAKSLAMSGLSVIGRDFYGVFPLKGKPLNARDAQGESRINLKIIHHTSKLSSIRSIPSQLEPRAQEHHLHYGPQVRHRVHAGDRQDAPLRSPDDHGRSGLRRQPHQGARHQFHPQGERAILALAHLDEDEYTPSILAMNSAKWLHPLKPLLNEYYYTQFVFAPSSLGGSVLALFAQHQGVFAAVHHSHCENHQGKEEQDVLHRARVRGMEGRSRWREGLDEQGERAKRATTKHSTTQLTHFSVLQGIGYEYGGRGEGVFR